MAKNKNLTQAKIKKDSEWYTLISDIEKELKYYKKYFLLCYTNLLPINSFK